MRRLDVCLSIYLYIVRRMSKFRVGGRVGRVEIRWARGGGRVGRGGEERWGVEIDSGSGSQAVRQSDGQSDGQSWGRGFVGSWVRGFAGGWSADGVRAHWLMAN
jgi:hypothetical protein